MFLIMKLPTRRCDKGQGLFRLRSIDAPSRRNAELGFGGVVLWAFLTHLVGGVGGANIRHFGLQSGKSRDVLGVQPSFPHLQSGVLKLSQKNSLAIAPFNSTLKKICNT